MINNDKSLNIYSPEITHSTIYFPRCGTKPYLRYNHCVDVIPFQNKFFAAWNANSTGKEGIDGQYNFLSISEDFKYWSAPIKIFAGDLCTPPVYSDRQWQPSFINYKDKKIFCAWCDTQAKKTYIASSTDGRNWKNQEIPPNQVPADQSQLVAFPTNHGLLTKQGNMIFPVSYTYPEMKDLGRCRFAGVLYSHDGGNSWQWSELVESATWDELGITPENPLMDRPALWEPAVYEYDDGKLGLLVRNSTTTVDNPSIKPEHLLLFSQSNNEGRSWTQCRTVELETVVSRCYAEYNEKQFRMVHNDWTGGIPGHIPDDRYNLALFLSSTENPDYLLPGPLVQPSGGRAFYPNGFTHNGKMYLAYTYPDYIGATIIHDLPDSSRPFLLPRGSREGLQIDEENITLMQPQATLGLVLPDDMIQADCISLEFAFEPFVRRESDFPLLSIGGKNRCGARLLLRFDETLNMDQLILASSDGQETFICRVSSRSLNHICLKLHQNRITISNDTEQITVSGNFMRKIAFGGLYEQPIYPPGSKPVQDVIHIPIHSICVSK